MHRGSQRCCRRLHHTSTPPLVVQLHAAAGTWSTVGHAMPRGTAVMQTAAEQSRQTAATACSRSLNASHHVRIWSMIQSMHATWGHTSTCCHCCPCMPRTATCCATILLVRSLSLCCSTAAAVLLRVKLRPPTASLPTVATTKRSSCAASGCAPPPAATLRYPDGDPVHVVKRRYELTSRCDRVRHSGHFKLILSTLI